MSASQIHEWETQVLDGLGGTQKSLARYALSSLVDLATRADERLRMIGEYQETIAELEQRLRNAHNTGDRPDA